jgi:hypothetical protein
MATGCSPSVRSLRSRRELGVSENTYHRVRGQVRRDASDDVKRMRHPQVLLAYRRCDGRMRLLLNIVDEFIS